MALIDHSNAPDVSSLNMANLLILCPNCHRLLDTFHPREVEFSDFFAGLLKTSPDFRRIAQDSRIVGHENARADFIVEERVSGSWQRILLECRATMFLRSGEVDGCIAQLGDLRARAGITRGALVLPGSVLTEDAVRIEAAGIELWDRDYLAARFRQQIADAEVTPYLLLLRAVGAKAQSRTADVLLERLAKCTPGKPDWVIYQHLIRDIFELLFTPPLDKPRVEFSNETRTNRPDMIMPNHATAGFWRYAREAYHADFVVVDAKNYVARFAKAQVLQIANYLKPHGAGMFAIIVSRLGADKGAMVTLREQWASQGKMILVVTDTDIRSMLTSYAANGRPEQIISDLITEFRLSM